MSRKADPIASDAMQPLETLPVFYPLEGKRVLVIGGGEGAAWKADLVAATGARVDIYTASPCARVSEIAQTRRNVSLHLRCVRVEDFTNATLAFGASFDDEEADHARKIADEAGVPLNLADRPQMSDFIMGAIVNRSPLVIGVSTGGASPVFAQAVRGRIETLVLQVLRHGPGRLKHGGQKSLPQGWILLVDENFGDGSPVLRFKISKPLRRMRIERISWRRHKLQAKQSIRDALRLLAQDQAILN